MASRTVPVFLVVLKFHDATKGEALLTPEGWGHRTIGFLNQSDAADYVRDHPEVYRDATPRIVPVARIELSIGVGRPDVPRCTSCLRPAGSPIRRCPMCPPEPRPPEKGGDE
jgi:hypothetical protein